MAKLHFNYAAMSAGKSLNLLQTNFNYSERGMNALMLAPYSAGHSRSHCNNRVEISSRIGLKADALGFAANDDLFNLILLKVTEGINYAPKSVDCVLVDEAQFLTRLQVKQLCRVVDEIEVPVLCYGLRSDYIGNGFPGSEALMIAADVLTEVKTMCFCGRKASMNLRLDEDGFVVTEMDLHGVLEKSNFTSLCRKHHSEAMSGKLAAYPLKGKCLADALQ